jgi:hypothetical protein
VSSPSVSFGAKDSLLRPFATFSRAGRGHDWGSVLAATFGIKISRFPDRAVPPSGTI